jgi:K+-sensing histidine kinase KdpD
VAVIDNLITEYRTEFPAAKFDRSLPENATVVVTPAIEYAFNELFENAIKHAQTDPPTMEVSVVAERGFVRIEITDDGAPLSEMEYSFLDSSEDLNSTFHPSGLGLWSVYVTVMESEGSLTVENNGETGNTITIKLPAPSSDWEPD